ncbi:Flp family type IVb pilin [Planctomycetota bacterium]
MLRKLWADERGTETVEWAIIIGLIAVAAIAVVAVIGKKVENSFKGLNTGMTASEF